MYYETKRQPLLSRKKFALRLLKNFSYGAVVILISLFIGIIGYRYFENLTWVDAFLNASMILSGMGPVNPLHTEGSKLFAGFYALFSGIIFLVIMGIIFAPIYHRFIHRFHLKDDK